MRTGRPPNVKLFEDDYTKAAAHSKAYRSRKQLTQMHFAIQLGCECCVISRIETGKGRRHSAITAKILSLELPPVPELTAATAAQG